MRIHQVSDGAEGAFNGGPAPAALASSSQELFVRRLAAGDRPAIEAHLLALAPADRTRRFHGLLGDDAVRDYVRRIDFARMILIGAFELAGGGLAGLAEAHLDAAEEPLRAEVSVSVLSGHRGRGIGRLLVAVALDAAAARGTRRADFHYQSGNRGIARLVRDLGPAVARSPGFARFALPLGMPALH